jgi:methylated-DNA-[protein]-cysteine S-methyltransferase
MQITIARMRSAFGMIYLAATPRGLVAVQVGGSYTGWKVGLAKRFPDAVVEEESGKLLKDAARQLQEYYAGRRTKFQMPIDWSGLTDFQSRVLRVVNAIPYGKTRTYGEVAAAVGKPGAARAAGGAIGSNPLAPVVPCHRVVAASGGLGGYSGAGGVKTKKKLLEMEINIKPSRS